MVIFDRRLPTKREIYLLFAACSFPVFLWSFLILLSEVPALILRSSITDTIIVAAYTQSAAFLESAGLTLLLLLLSLLLPASWFRDRLVPQGTLMGVITAVWAISLRIQVGYVMDFHLLPYGLALVLAPILLRFRPGLEAVLISTVERISVLSVTYASFGLGGLILAVARNL